MLRRLGRFLLVLLVLFLVLVLFVRSPWGQNIIVSKVTAYVSDKTGTEVEIDRLFLTFSGNIFLEGLYLEDKKGDTLVYSKTLEANLPITPIIFNNEIHLKSLDWDGLKARVSRNEGSEDFNFTFLIDAFAATDSTATPNQSGGAMTIDVGSVNFENFDLAYDDGFMGIESNLILGKLFLEADQIDLEKMRFEIEDFELYDTEVSYLQSKPFPEVQDTTTTQLPFLSVENFKISNLSANYNSEPDETIAEVVLREFLLELPKADLAKNEIEVDLLALKNSKVSVIIGEQEEVRSDTLAKTDSTFEWPQFIVDVAKIDIENNDFAFRTGDSTVTGSGFNPENVAFSNFTLQTDNITYRPKLVNLILDELSFKEKSGFEIKKMAIDANLNENSASISALNVATGYSSMMGNLEVDFSSIDDLLENPENSQLNVSIPNLKVGLQDAYFFQPDLANNEYVKKADQESITGNLRASGTLAHIDIQDLGMNWGQNTSLSSQGEVLQITQPDSLSFDFNNAEIRTVRSDMLKFISEKDIGISLPETVLVLAEASGRPDDISANVKLKIPEGRVHLEGSYANRNQIAFEGTLKIDSLQVDKLLQNEQLGALSFQIEASGSGENLNTLNASLTSDFTQLNLKGYDFSNLFLEGEIVDGKGDLDLNFKDDNLNFKAHTNVELDSVDSNVNLDLNVVGADLYALGVTREDIKAGVNINAQFKGNAEDFTVDALLSEGIAVHENEQYQMGDVKLSTRLGKTQTEFSISSNFLNGILKSNATPNKITIALQRQFKGYFSDTVASDTLYEPVELEVEMALSPVPILTNVFLKGVERLDSVHVRANFDSRSKNLEAGVYMPTLVYNGSSIDSLDVTVKGDATDLNFSAGFAELLADPINVKRTFFKGNLKNKELLLDFDSYDEQERLAHISSELILEKDSINLHINPAGLVFNKKEWSIPQDNRIVIADKYLGLRNITLSRNTQELTLSNSVEGIEKEHVGLTFDNFKLQTIVSLLNPDEALASGMVKGHLVIENPFEAPGVVADFDINKLELMQNPLGNLSLDAVSKGSSTYDFDLSLKDGGVDLDLTGDYAAAETGARLNLDLDLNKLELTVVEGLSEGALKDSHGFISGKVEVSGTTVEPQYNGSFEFNDTDFNVATLNSVFKINNETVKIDNAGLYLDSFKIEDSNGGVFTVDGDILTEQLTNPSFDLTFKAEEFRVLDSTKDDNKLYYGTASIDADLSVKGDLELPEIEGRLKVRKVTEVTYVVPEEQLDVQERDGVVIFVNRENPDAILTRNDQEDTPAVFTGFDLSAILEIADDAVFNVIVDERTGDNLQVSGDAELNLNMSPNGRINLTGRYELNSGHYETSLYNLVKRRFSIKPGGTITWRGDPTDAALDVTAIYEVETSAAPLMAAVTSGQDVSVTGKYQQVLPFMVYLNVEGELLQPELSFDLDMPEDEQGSLGGAVYGRVQQLNEQETALNKQVFSLLALNRFFPDTGSDGSSGGAAALARNNVNKVLSGQLNAFSDKIFGQSGFELDFDLDSFTDYQGDSPQDRTQLNINAKKKLFDDRLVVTAGSAVDVEGSAQSGQGQTPIIGNVSLEYLLTEDGRYRLKGFRKNEYENVIDGQLIITGLALIFNREFNEFSQLFNPLKDNDEKDETKNASE
ncbi:uncharacterized protein DUF490 [Flavobacteriaceae bacterium MAR_2009_75]|nr:uncharacterized protein DUF490 [Flavobacteriaceae bacterium MAR_2009_75]